MLILGIGGLGSLISTFSRAPTGQVDLLNQKDLTYWLPLVVASSS